MTEDYDGEEDTRLELFFWLKKLRDGLEDLLSRPRRTKNFADLRNEVQGLYQFAQWAIEFCAARIESEEAEHATDANHNAGVSKMDRSGGDKESR